MVSKLAESSAGSLFTVRFFPDQVLLNVTHNTRFHRAHL